MADNWTFNRGLSDKLIDALNDLYASRDSWWRAIADDKQIYLAIRAGVLTAYYRGCSLAEIGLRNGEVQAKTHYKYLLKPNLDEYVSAVAGEYKFRPGWRDGAFVGSLLQASTTSKQPRSHFPESRRTS